MVNLSFRLFVPLTSTLLEAEEFFFFGCVCADADAVAVLAAGALLLLLASVPAVAAAGEATVLPVSSVGGVPVAGGAVESLLRLAVDPSSDTGAE